MNIASHFLTGIFVQIIIGIFIPSGWWSPIIIAFTAFLSHFFIDAIVERFTYHPRFPERHPKAVIVTTFIEIILGVAVALYFSEYWLGILFSVGVDLYDWLLLRAILRKDFKEDYQLFLHRFCDRIQDRFLKNAWNLNEKPRGFFVEILFISMAWIGNIALIY